MFEGNDCIIWFVVEVGFNDEVIRFCDDVFFGMDLKGGVLEDGKLIFDRIVIDVGDKEEVCIELLIIGIIYVDIGIFILSEVMQLLMVMLIVVLLWSVFEDCQFGQGIVQDFIDCVFFI